MRWELLHVQSQQQEEGGLKGGGGPGKRWGHTCNSVRGGSFLYVFGGYGRDNCQTNQVHVFDTAKQTWSQPTIKGQPPAPRDSHSCTTVGDNLYVFGGTDGLNPLGDLYILDTVSHTWISPSIRGDGPEAREGHSAALVGKRLFIFGGCGKSVTTNEEVYYNDLYMLNTETLVWKHLVTTGNPPSPRDSHTCSSWNNKFFVIGGEDVDDYYLSDVHVLDAETLVWKELITTGQKLPPRAGHCTVAMGKHLCVFGGFTDAQNLYDDVYMLDVDSAIWTKVAATGHVPSARFSASGDCLDPAEFGVLMFFGGCDKTLEALDDMYYLHTGIPGLQDEQRLEKLSLRKQLKLKCQEQIINSPAYDKALVRVDAGPQFHHTFQGYAQPARESYQANQAQFHQGKKTFQAKVTESLLHGYTIETFIDGKPLRGILFANKPASPQIVNLSNSRKRASAEVGVVMSNGDCDGKSKVSRTSKEDAVDLMQVDSVHVEEQTTNETKTEAAAASGVQNLIQNFVPSDVSQPKEAATTQDPSVAPPLNLNDDVRTDVRISAGDQKEMDIVAKDSNTLPAVEEDSRTLVAEVQTDPGTSAQGVNVD